MDYKELYAALLKGDLNSLEGVDLQETLRQVEEDYDTKCFAVVHAKQRVDVVEKETFSILKSYTTGYIQESLYLLSINLEGDETPSWCGWETQLVGVDEVLDKMG